MTAADLYLFLIITVAAFGLICIGLVLDDDRRARRERRKQAAVRVGTRGGS